MRYKQKHTIFSTKQLNVFIEAGNESLATLIYSAPRLVNIYFFLSRVSRWNTTIKSFSTQCTIRTSARAYTRCINNLSVKSTKQRTCVHIVFLFQIRPYSVRTI